MFLLISDLKCQTKETSHVCEKLRGWKKIIKKVVIMHRLDIKSVLTYSLMIWIMRKWANAGLKGQILAVKKVPW